MVRLRERRARTDTAPHFRVGGGGLAAWMPGEILFTSMDNDGTNAGFACEATARISQSVDIPVIASGGAGSLAILRCFCLDAPMHSGGRGVPLR